MKESIDLYSMEQNRGPLGVAPCRVGPPMGI